MKKYLILCGCHKSGTSLLRSVFDGGDNIFAVPIETHFFYLLNFWINYPYRTNKGYPVWNKDIIIDNFYNWIIYSNNKRDVYADSITYGLFNEENFKEYLIDNISEENVSERQLKPLFDIYIDAIYYSLYGKEISKDILIVEKSVENFETALLFNDILKENSSFVHILRNPFSNINSIRKYKTFLGDTRMDKVVKTIYKSFYYAEHNKQLIDRYYTIKYEDLLNEPEINIKQLCIKIKISFDESFTTPTSLGDQWKGNSIHDKKFKKISNDNLNEWKNYISPYEIKLVHKHLNHIIKKYNYDDMQQINNIIRILKPFPKEKIKNYLYNRLLCVYDNVI